MHPQPDDIGLTVTVIQGSDFGVIFAKRMFPHLKERKNSFDGHERVKILAFLSPGETDLADPGHPSFVVQCEDDTVAWFYQHELMINPLMNLAEILSEPDEQP